ncbi:hypothetical protein DHEL01_v208645 [Diaporthe helianthi]|uniref:Uncharacterized protein n=1 Tax=Diaporthe helianthi TaxID=158607 RepID=A0A2P5HRY1_DIAHE|nr:hypothetical protein DHEL01_v208645 [Diaporthe helianthi]
MASKSKSVLVTGCSAGGLGAAIAANIAKTSGAAHHVFATARNTAKIPEELSGLPNVTVLELDITSAPSVTAAAKAVESSGHGLDVLVNNAGAGYASPIIEMDIEEAKQTYEINVWGTIRTIQGFGGLLIKSHGRIVNVSTVGSVLNMPWISPYSSSKAALNNISESLRLELSPFGVSVVTILVGLVETHFHSRDMHFKLRPDSLYAPIEETIEVWANGKSKPKGQSAEDFDASIAGDILGQGKGGMVWKGPNAGSIKWATSLLPTSLMDSSLSQGQGLEELAAEVSKNQ